MNNLIEQFFDLEDRQRLLVCALAVLLLAGAYWYFVFSGRRAEMKATLVKIAELRDQRDHKQKLISSLDAVRGAVRELQGQVHEAEVRLPDSKEIPDLLSTVSSAGRESGLEILLFRQKPERFQDFYAEVPVDVLVRGNYHQVATFFDRVGQLDRIVNVSDISMKEPKIENGSLIVDTACSAVTFRFLDEAERERIAKEKAEKSKKN
jgi:type IV pilus assembly protein PilO